MSDEALANNIEYLIKEAIIVVPSSANYAEAKSIASALGEMQDRMNRIEMMIGNTGGNIDPSPMITTTLGSLGDRVSKLETMLIDTVPLPESGIDVIQKTARHVIPAGTSQGKVAYCDSGYIATGGGYRYVTANHHVSDNMPLSDLKGWKVWIKNNDKYNDIKVEVYAICMKLR